VAYWTGTLGPSFSTNTRSPFAEHALETFLGNCGKLLGSRVEFSVYAGISERREAIRR